MKNHKYSDEMTLFYITNHMPLPSLQNLSDVEENNIEPPPYEDKLPQPPLYEDEHINIRKI
jgi:hypothetical protein